MISSIFSVYGGLTRMLKATSIHIARHCVVFIFSSFHSPARETMSTTPHISSHSPDLTAQLTAHRLRELALIFISLDIQAHIFEWIEIKLNLIIDKKDLFSQSPRKVSHSAHTIRESVDSEGDEDEVIAKLTEMKEELQRGSVEPNALFDINHSPHLNRSDSPHLTHPTRSREAHNGVQLSSAPWTTPGTLFDPHSLSVIEHLPFAG
eukprot:GHVN01099771.1.p1 GENE.GHVN01099771.1~~GHVN01099771.1.p1  ORF type:complete len:207 (-),score=73.53 GHVN01099771.1:64-684(-)